MLMMLAVRARSLTRLMEGATIHSDVGGINGLRLSIYYPMSIDESATR
jgi:hypothetical protein